MPPSTAVDPRASPRPFTVGTVAVVSTRKGSDLFVEAARACSTQRQRRRDFRFEMVGAAHDAIERDWAHARARRAPATTGIEHIPQTDVFERLARLGRVRAPVARRPVPALDARGDGERPAGDRHPPRRDRRADRARHRAADRAREPARARRRDRLVRRPARADARKRSARPPAAGSTERLTLEHQSAATDGPTPTGRRSPCAEPPRQPSSTSRCTTRSATSSRAARWRAIRSATVIERWRPPVQPIAIVRWVLPSAT